jgi:chromosome segregation ATPase
MMPNYHTEGGTSILIGSLEQLKRDREQLATALEEAVRQADFLDQERNRLVEQLGQRDALLRDQETQLREPQRQVRQLQEQVEASRAAALQYRAELNVRVEELQVTALRSAEAGTWDWDMVEDRATWSDE